MIKFLSTFLVAAAVPPVAHDVRSVTSVSPAESSMTTAASAAAVPPVATMIPAEAYKAQVVCRSEVETGSLMKKRKTCLTWKQWAYVNDQHESAARKVVEDNAGRPTTN